MTTTMTTPIQRPVSDQRQYHFFTIGKNGLQCLAIQDPTATHAALALDCAVGQLQDETLPGLAHLAEHIMFLGSLRYEHEHELDQYLAKAGGHSNAWTDLHHTVYYCDCHVAHLSGAVERFGDGLANPRMASDAIRREIMAVDSEHAKNVYQDHWRFHQLTKQVIAADTQHVYGQFGTGSLQSLLPTEDQLSELQSNLRTFYQKYYHAQNMRLVILGQQTTNELEQIVQTSPFADIQPTGNAPPKIPPLPPPKAVTVHAKPLQESTRLLELQWTLPPTQSLYRTKPTRILSHLLGHEAKNSLLAVLRQAQWAQELTTDDVSKSSNDFSILTLKIELTQLGLTKVHQIIALVYAYIQLMKLIPSWMYEEMATMAQLNFRYLSQSRAAETVSGLVTGMHVYAPEHVVSGPYLHFAHDPELVQQFVRELIPENMLVLLVYGNAETDQEDPHYGTQYKVVPATEEQMEQWKHPPSDLGQELKLPTRNDMIATDFALLEPSIDVFRHNDDDDDENHIIPPWCILNDQQCQRVWYKPDTAFEMPKVNIMLLFRSCTAYVESAEASTLASLWAEVVQESCNDFSYMASMAGLHCAFVSTRRGMEIHVSGYHHKAHVLLEKIVHTIQRLNETVTSELLERVREKLRHQYDAFLTAQPYQHAIYVADLCLETPKWSVFDRLKCLDHIGLEEFRFFTTRLNREFFLEVLVHGNVSPEHAIEISTLVKSKLQSSPAKQLPTLRVVQLNPGKDYVHRMKGWSTDNTNSVILNAYQMGPMEPRTNAILSVLHHLVKEPFFRQLRTQEQCGYIVHSQVKTNGENIKGLLFLIQSDAYDPIHMDNRIEVFLEEFRTELVQLSEEEFRSNVESVVQNLLEKNKSLTEESSKHWGVIINQTYRFTKLRDIANEARTLQKVDILRLFDRYVLVNSPNRQKLSIQLFGTNHSEKIADGVTDGVVHINDIQDFVKSQALYPTQTEVDMKNHILQI